MKRELRKEAAASRPMTKRQLSRHQREQRQRMLIFGVAGGLAALIVFILLFGFYREFIGIGDEPVARVGDKVIPTRDVSRLLGYYDGLYANQIAEVQAFVAAKGQAQDEATKKQVEAAGDRLQQVQSFASQADSQAVDWLIEGEILRREAATRNLQIDQNDRDRALFAQLDLGIEYLAQQLIADEAGTTPPGRPEATEAQLNAARERIKTVLENGRILSEAEFNRLVLEPAAIQLKLQNELSAPIPVKTEQVHARHILFKTEQQAKENLDLIEAGSLDFAEAAKQLSEDTLSKEKGGDLGWFPRGVMDPAFEEAAFGLAPGQMSEVVTTSFGFHIVKVEEKAQEREVSPPILERQRSSAYYKWLGEARNAETNKVVYEYNQAKAKWARDNAVKPTLAQAKG